MKKFIQLILLVILAISCKETTKDSKSENNKNKVATKEVISIKPKSEKNATYLCKINGKDWAYTKASGIIDTHAKTKVRTAIITFKKKLEKGSENVQLYYNPETFELTAVAIQLRFLQKDGTTSTCYYNIKPETRSKNPLTKLEGNIDLSNPTKASGTAEIKNLNINYEKDKLKNIEDAVITVSELKFSDVGYSDLDKVFKID
ncbi:hypothetical protein [uncultured Maribacter sp.]|uniref:hypothetical protein n=1 Tax=uncultured Maribacter sp. TaxID=431308 RepID=UPI0030ED74FC|tara:strand:- start:23392 stop:24000 length:609 start_codon:yes stop_codon:yes gene_type:complete